MSGEIEAAFIGGCLIDGGPRLGLVGIVDASCFTHPMWQESWSQIAKAWRAGHPAEFSTIAHAVAVNLNREPADIQRRLTGAMADDTGGTIWHTKERGRALRQLAARRELVKLAGSVAEGAYDQATGADGVVSLTTYARSVLDLLDDWQARDESGDLASVAEAAEAARESGMPTGIGAFDSWCGGGLRRGECVILAGNTGVGKSWVSTHMATGLADRGYRVGFFTLEMRPADVYIRFVANLIGSGAFRLRSGEARWPEEEYQAYVRAREVLESWPLSIYGDQRSVAAIEAKTRAAGLDVAIIDYAQLLDSPPGTSSRYEAQTASANALQRMAHRTPCAVVIASQQSREAIRAGRNSAALGALESGRWDQIADMWLLIESNDDSPGITLTPRKSRHTAAHGSATYRLDKDTGELVLVSEG